MRFARNILLFLILSVPMYLQGADTNGSYVEIWLGKLGNAVGIAGYPTSDGQQFLFIAGSDGLVRPLVLSAPSWQWAWRNPIMRHHDNIVGIAAYFHPGDGRQHCFVALQTGDVWEAVFASLDDPSSLSENWLGKLEGGAVAVAGISRMDRSQQLFVAGRDGLVHPLEIGPGTAWQWAWRAPVMSYHAGIVGITAYYHPNDGAAHVFVALETGDIWEAFARPGTAWNENWLGILDGGATRLAGHSASNGTQHLFSSGAVGQVLPLQIGPPYWKWRWDEPIMASHDGIVGLISYEHPGDGKQHVIAALQTGNIWESRFQLRSQVATSEWSPRKFPISYWYGPPDLVDSPAKYQLIAGAGFTFAMPPGRAMDPKDNFPVLAAVSNVGLKMFITDRRIEALTLSTNTTLDNNAKQTLDAVIADYSGHSAVAGYYLCDEPPNGCRDGLLAELVEYFRKHDPAHGCYINVLPSHAGAGAQYLETYLTVTNPFVLSFDHYSLLADGTDEKSFFDNLHIVREKSIDHGLPFWQIILSVGHGPPASLPPGYRQPTYAEKRYEAMQVLAFGGKGILYFTYWQPPPGDGFEPAIVDAAGVPTAQYDEVRRINADIHTIGRYLLEAQSTLVFENGVLPFGGTPPPIDAPVLLSGNANITVGLFSRGVYQYALLASRDYRSPVSTGATFKAQVLQRLDKLNDAWIDIDPSFETRIDLAPGDADLFRFIKFP